MGRPAIAPETRFYEKFEERPDGCWEWTGKRIWSGYGSFWDGKRLVGAHRFSFEMHRGPIPQGLCVCHTCDNRWCVNPSHFFLGTDADNMADKCAKGRQARGSKYRISLLTEEQVLEIKILLAEGKTYQYEIARRYGVTQTAISLINIGKNWSHVEGPPPARKRRRRSDAR